MSKFIATLIKSVGFTWLSLFLVIYPVVMLVLGGLNGLNVLAVSGDAVGLLVWSLTAIFFASFWVRAYADKLSSWIAVLRMKWDLRGLDKD